MIKDLNLTKSSVQYIMEFLNLDDPKIKEMYLDATSVMTIKDGDIKNFTKPDNMTGD